MEFVTKSNLTKYTTYLNEYLKKYYLHLDSNGYLQNPNLTGATVGTSGNNNYLKASIPSGTTGEKSPNWYYATDGSLLDISTKTVASANKLSNTVKIWGNDFDGSSDIDGDITLNGSIIVGSIVDDPLLIDLGLSSGTLWMDRNVGASSPEDAGLYFAWGETTGYTADEVGKTKQFSWNDYKFGTIGNLTKYNSTDGLTTLETSDDAVLLNVHKYSMPTKEQLQELIDGTTSTWTTQNGVNGMLFTSKTNGNSIFVPAAGCGTDDSLGNVGSHGYLWSSSLYEGNTFNGRGLFFYSGHVNLGCIYRCYCGSVRGVATPAEGSSKIITLPSSSGTLALDNVVTTTSNGLMSSSDKTNLDNHLINYNNPHKVTKNQINLGNVDNTADSLKNVLSATKLTTSRTIWGQSFDGTSNISGDATYLMSINNSDGDSITSINNEPSNTNHFIQFGKLNRDYVLWNEYGGVWKFNSGTNGVNFLVQLGNTNYFANNIGIGTISPSESVHTTGNVKASEYKLTDGSVYAEPCTTDEINSLFE